MAGRRCERGSEDRVSLIAHAERAPSTRRGRADGPAESRGSADAPRLGRVLHDGRDLAHHDARARVLAVDLPVGLGRLARLCDEDAEVGTHARVDHADVGADEGDLRARTEGEGQRGELG